MKSPEEATRYLTEVLMRRPDLRTPAAAAIVTMLVGLLKMPAPFDDPNKALDAMFNVSESLARDTGIAHLH